MNQHIKTRVRGRRTELSVDVAIAADTTGRLYILKVGTVVGELPTWWFAALRASDRCKRIKIAESYVALVVPVAVGFRIVQGWWKQREGHG